MDRETLEKLYWEAGEAEVSETGVFDGYYSHLRGALLRGLKECRKGKTGEIPKITPEWWAAFTGKMQRITLRTLIFEMELCGEEGKLAGGTAQEQYACFEREFLGSPGWRRELYGIYPVMYEGVLRILEDAVRNVDELLDRFAEDREGLCRRFYPGNPCGEIRMLGGGGSDSHRHGGRVHILELDNGEKLVYKPRSLAVDEAYGGFLEWVYENAETDFWWNQVWDRGAYGWCQWVEAMPCPTREGLGRYYYRNGVLMCVGCLLGSEDIHYENLIAHGEYPVIVDLETAVGNRMGEGGGGWTETERFYRESVLQTGLLPVYTWNGSGEGVNIGTVNGRGGQLMSIITPVVAEPGTVNMRIVYRRPAMGEGKNLATWNGTFVEPREFLGEMQEGFRRAYTFLAEHRESVMERLEPFRNVQVRCLVRGTQQYAMLLTTLGHPDFLTGAAEGQAVWARLEKGMEEGAASEWVRAQEKKELRRWDVPYFYCGTCGRALYSGTGERWEDFFGDTAMHGVEERLMRMCAVDMERQEKLIRRALVVGTEAAAGERGCGLTGTEAAAGQRGCGLAAAEKLAGLMLEEAVWSQDRKDAGWISIIMAGYRERSYLVRPMDPYLYGGLAGAAVFMAELAGRTGKTEYREAKNVLASSLFRHTDDLCQGGGRRKRATGAYQGEASIALAYMLLHSVDGDAKYLSYLRKQCGAAAGWLAEDRQYDVLGGNAGAALVLLKAYRLTGEERYRMWAREAGDCLLKSAVPYEWGTGWVNPSAGKALTGYAHGAAGIMLALAMLGHVTGEGKYTEAAYQAYRYEEHYFREDLQDWEDLRGSGETPQESRMAWCHGWGGIVMARLAASEYVEGRFREELKGAGDFARKKIRDGCPADASSGANLCLCHGKCGNAALLYGMGEREEAERMQNQVLGEICQAEDVRKRLEVQECENFGLMSGIAGIGYGCLCPPEKALELLCIR